MGIRVSNNAVSALSVSIDSTATTIQVRTGEGDRFPLLTEGQWFPATIFNVAGDLEIIKVTERDGDVFTVERGQEGTTAKEFLAGSPIELRLTAEVVSQILNRIGDAAAAAASAQDAADAADGKAVDAQETADLALQAASDAENAADAAALAAAGAQGTANSALDAAGDAMEAAGSAQEAADDAADAASGAQGTANNALDAANASLKKSSNLSDLTDAATARDNLGLGSMATKNVTISSSDPSGGQDGDIWIKV